jgi:stearoyl-CoA desaturase (Delta-9 desaturase)
MFQPLFDLSWLQWALVALVFTQLTIFSVTLHLHRAQAHRALDLHPAVSHPMRFWLWLSTAMSTLEWVAVHRKHHAHCETDQDPHSPKRFGLGTVLFKGAALYAREAANPQTIERYGRGVPVDWMERHVYLTRKNLGPVLMGLVNVSLFGWTMGLALCAVQFLWIPAWAAGVINGLAHAKGYRNFATQDESRNLLPWGVWIGGEELHNNHHAHATSAKLSYHWWEVDIGWGAIRVLQALKLATVRKAARPPMLQATPQSCSPALVKAIAEHQLQVGRWFHQAWGVTLKELQASRELTTVQARLLRRSWQHAKAYESEKLHATLDVMHQRWAELQELWTNRKSNADELTQKLAAWCDQAERSRVASLRKFSQQLRRLPV